MRHIQGVGGSENHSRPSFLSYYIGIDMITPELVLRFHSSGTMMIWDTITNEPVRCPTQNDMDSLPVGPDMSEEEYALLSI